MACSQSYFFLSLLLLFSILCINHTAMCDDEEENLLRGINSYRATLNLSALTENDKAECLAEEIADEFKNKPCTNTTGANTVPGTEPQFSDYPNLLAKCKLNVTTTRDGAILPACVPNLVQDVVLTNYTQSQYAGSLNDSKYTGIGIGSDDNWIVVILTTNTPTILDGDEEENLLRGINSYRANLNLPALTENDKAECLAEEIADQFQNQPCTNTTGVNTVPGTEPRFSDYPNLLAKCKLNVTTDGVILPACIPNLVQDVVLTSYTHTQYSASLNDSKYTGIGIGSDDNWIVVILTTNTPTILDGDEEENLLRGINSYRANLNLPALTENDKAECLAEEIADQFQNQPCTNTTGVNTVQGTEPRFSDYPNLLAKCKLNVTTDGVILPACVPNLVQDVVLTSYTHTQYSASLNDSKYTGIGIGSDDNWIVVILTTNTSSILDGDEEENLLRGINSYRANLNLSALTENDKVECLAEEIADEFKNKPCTNTTGANTVPGTELQFSDYPNLLAKCKLNVTTRDGVILPACVPNLVPGVVLSNYIQSQYSGSLNDSKYTGIGIGSDDNWSVVILTTNTSTRGFAVGSSDSDNFGSKLSPVHPMLFLLMGLLFLMGTN